MTVEGGGGAKGARGREAEAECNGGGGREALRWLTREGVHPQDKLKDLDKEMSKLQDDDTPLTRNIRTLENRLDKAMIKYNEAQVRLPPTHLCCYPPGV